MIEALFFLYASLRYAIISKITITDSYASYLHWPTLPSAGCHFLKDILVEVLDYQPHGRIHGVSLV